YYCVAEDGEVVLWADGDLTDESWDSVWVWARDVWLES
ncbi:SMI1/KNR4 family protein, partial [Pseudomonas aeruginosa]